MADLRHQDDEPDDKKAPRSNKPDIALAITATVVLVFSWVVTVTKLAHKEWYVLAFLMTLLVFAVPLLFWIWLRERRAERGD